MKKIMFLAIILPLAFSTETALADVSYFHPGKHKRIPGPISDSEIHSLGMPVTRAFDLEFKQWSSMKFILTSKTNLNSGKIKDAYIVASFRVEVIPPTQLGLRWTPGKGETNNWYTKVRGRYNNQHVLSLHMTTETYVPTALHNGWVVTNDSIENFHGTIYTNGDQDVPADIYTISMDASAFIS
ncbi:hypothetical protein QNA27_18375 [Pantoea eucalypti]|uniref:hypothetical protein n=1 Tax=Pantoea eucalypti TaxID=470933 RepID=UPI0024B88D42|nr:hypothetical protein [Pantoea eucalypti]MDJ0475627.1 hypothetical protein [Pantoea eucalypti]